MLTRSQNRKRQTPPVFPVTTLVQTVGNRPYERSARVIYGTSVAILTFPSGITLMIPSQALSHLDQVGTARLTVHRKFLTDYGRYLHWLAFMFVQSGIKVTAQIVLVSRLGAACQMISEGGTACFLANPLRTFRRSRNTRSRICITSRSLLSRMCL